MTTASLERITTAGGHPAVFAVRDDTSDAALVGGIIGGREYDLPTGLSGWAIDVGAHIGIVTVALALDNPDLRIVAVEALESNVELCYENVKRNGLLDRVTVRHGAAATEAERRGWEKRNDPPGIPIVYGWSRADNQPDHYMHDNRYIGGMVGPNESSLVEMCIPESLSSTFDVDLDTQIEEVELLKIDCEGCEWHYLTSPEIVKVKRIIGELHHGKNGGAKEFRALLEPTHEVTMDDALVVATFEAVRR